MTRSPELVLTLALGASDLNRGLLDGSVGIQAAVTRCLTFTSPERHWRMFRRREFDIAEVSFGAFLSIQEQTPGEFVAIPAFPHRRFRHSYIFVGHESALDSPAQLANRRIGLRTWTNTAGVWVRGILQDQYGVDLSKITWVLNDEEHVEEYQKHYPANVSYQAGANLGEMVASGELAAAIGVGRVDSPDVKPLIPNAREAETAWYQKTGIYPINHAVVVKDSLLQADPTLAPRLFNAFKEAKAAFLMRLGSGAELSSDEQALAQRRSLVGDDPLPYGLAPNRKALEAVIRFAHDQKILPRLVSPEEVFAHNTLDLD